MIQGIGGQSFSIQPPQELPGLSPAKGNEAQGSETAGPSFGSTFKQFLGEVNDMQIKAGGLMESFARGEAKDLHQVVLAQQEAAISVRLVSEMRDRLVQAYQEVMRTTM
jgi:flagellar hook-basal body complex protein FliE